MTYEPVFNQITSITDPLGHTTTLTYDATGNVTRMSDGLQHASTFTYGSDGQPTSVADPLGHVTTYAYVAGRSDRDHRFARAIHDEVSRRCRAARVAHRSIWARATSTSTIR